MSRVLLISTNRATTPYVVYPLGMAVVAGALNKLGHQVEQLDMLATAENKDRLQQTITQFNPNFICL